MIPENDAWPMPQPPPEFIETTLPHEAMTAADTGPFRNKEEAAERLARGRERMFALQERMYAQDTWAMLLTFQAMDAAGKDSAIKHVMSGLNPQGTMVFSFKRPSDEELDHDFL